MPWRPEAGKRRRTARDVRDPRQWRATQGRGAARGPETGRTPSLAPPRAIPPSPGGPGRHNGSEGRESRRPLAPGPPPQRLATRLVGGSDHSRPPRAPPCSCGGTGLGWIGPGAGGRASLVRAPLGLDRAEAGPDRHDPRLLA